MKTKTLSVLLTLFLLLIASFFALRFYLGSDRGRETVGQGEIDFRTSELNSDTINTLFISQGGERVELVQGERGWYVDGHPVDRERMELIWTKMKDMKVKGPAVSSNKENHARMEVEKEKGLEVVFKNGEEEKAHFIIGKIGSMYNTVYIRNPQSDEVYTTASEIRSLFIPFDKDSWRDKIVFDMREVEKELKRVEYEFSPFSSKNFSLEISDEKKWKAKDKKGNLADVPDELMNTLKESISPLRATGFVDDEEKRKEFENAREYALVRFFGSSEESLEFSELRLVKQESEWWVKAEGKDTVFTISNYRVSDFIPEKEKLGVE